MSNVPMEMSDFTCQHQKYARPEFYVVTLVLDRSWFGFALISLCIEKLKLIEVSLKVPTIIYVHAYFKSKSMSVSIVGRSQT